MTLSLCLTVNNRPEGVSRQVAASLRLPGNQPDELILVLDRPTEDARDAAIAAYKDFDFPVRTIHIPGKPGWLCPARAWNHAFAAVTSDLIYCISSEVVQDAGNIEKAREICKDGKTVVFGACENSKPTSLVVGAEKGELASSILQRPLGFIACMPTNNVMSIGGCDEAFMDGLWFEDDDFYLRLWWTGVNFVFDDGIHGIHLDHPRPDLETPAGLAKTRQNAAIMKSKHGLEHVWNQLPRITECYEKRTIWKHPEDFSEFGL